MRLMVHNMIKRIFFYSYVKSLSTMPLSSIFYLHYWEKDLKCVIVGFTISFFSKEVHIQLTKTETILSAIDILCIRECGKLRYRLEYI